MSAVCRGAGAAGPELVRGRNPAAGGEEVVKRVRALPGDLTAGLKRSGDAPAEKLSRSEVEKRIAAYAKHMEQLKPEERRAVEEYCRLLRDIE